MTSYFHQKLGLNLYSSSSDPEEKNGTESHITKAAAAAAATTVAGNRQDDIHEQTQNDELECSKIKEMRALLLSRNPSFSQEVDDFMIRRFLRARDLNIEKAFHMLLKYLNWRKEFVPTGSIFTSQISNELAQNKTFMQGYDKSGRPIVVGFGGRHKQTSIEETQRYTTFVIDKICSRIPNGHEKYVTIMDLKGWGYANSDIRGSISSISILQDYYPERLGKLFVVNVPSVFMTLWKAVYPFIDSKTRQKIIFVGNKKLKETLLSDIDESQLPVTYGGKLQLIPIQDC